MCINYMFVAGSLLWSPSSAFLLHLSTSKNGYIHRLIKLKCRSSSSRWVRAAVTQCIPPDIAPSFFIELLSRILRLRISTDSQSQLRQTRTTDSEQAWYSTYMTIHCYRSKHGINVKRRERGAPLGGWHLHRYLLIGTSGAAARTCVNPSRPLITFTDFLRYMRFYNYVHLPCV